MSGMGLAPGDEIEGLKVTPDRYLTVRYAGASGDFNPIHIDEEFAKAVGLPGRILHGLWTMAQVARAAEEAAGGFQNVKRLSVQFRGMGQMEQEIVITGSEGEGGVLELEAEQAGSKIIRNGQAEIARS